jgi:hypothetical protein
MYIRPLYFGGSLQTVERASGQERVEEPTEASLRRALQEGKDLQGEICDIPLEERLQVIDWLGELWEMRLRAGELRQAKTALMVSTGYPESIIDMEFSLVRKVLDAEEIRDNLSTSLIGGAGSLEGFCSLREGEAIRHLPAGPVLIISSGNSIIPTLIPTVISVATGNFTLLKPSLSNYHAILEIFSSLGELMAKSPAAHLMAKATMVCYFQHDSPALETALTAAPVGVVNFWGGEPARTVVGQKVARNPHRPRFFVNGPLTGVAIIAEARADEQAAHGLALNMLLYEQQLCSSPTLALFIGGFQEATGFARRVKDHLRRIGEQYRTTPSDDALFVTQGARRVMQLKGSTVLSSPDLNNPWTIAISKDQSNLDQAVASFPSFGVHGRRRFIEMVVVPNVERAARIIMDVPQMRAFQGIDKVQTVGMALPEGLREEALWALASSGVYRFVPLEDMYMRSAIEPYDGVALASLFTYAVHERKHQARPGDRT